MATELADGVLTVTLDRPAKLNAFTVQMHCELIAAFDQADADHDVRCVVVTGAAVPAPAPTWGRAATASTAP